MIVVEDVESELSGLPILLETELGPNSKPSSTTADEYDSNFYYECQDHDELGMSISSYIHVLIAPVVS